MQNISTKYENYSNELKSNEIGEKNIYFYNANSFIISL